MREFQNIEFVGSFAKLEQCPESTLPEVAFIGRSNVGKSSLINTLCKQKGLAKTSSTPGKTQLMVFFNMNEQFHIVDLPGYGYAKVNKSSKKEFKSMIYNYIEKREQLWCLFILLDIRHKPMQVDKEFILKCGEMGIPFQLAFTKADKVTKNEKASNLAAYEKFLKQYWEEPPKMWVTTASISAGADELREYIMDELVSLKEE